MYHYEQVDWTIPHAIVKAVFANHPFRLETISKLVLLLHHIRRFANSTTNKERYPYLAYYST